MPKVVVVEGVERETLAAGERLMVVRFTFRKGAEVPWHSHEHEQSSFIVRGKLKVLLMRDQQEQEIILTQGMSAIVPPHTHHKAVAMEDTCLSPICSKSFMAAPE
jgi:quercetin dioxygenase-like cupin family protein